MGVQDAGMISTRIWILPRITTGLVLARVTGSKELKYLETEGVGCRGS